MEKCDREERKHTKKTHTHTLTLQKKKRKISRRRKEEDEKKVKGGELKEEGRTMCVRVMLNREQLFLCSKREHSERVREKERIVKIFV